MDASYFTLDSNAGEITLTRSPDFEVKSSYDISIRSSDDAAIPKSFSKSFSIAVNDVNEAPVFDVSNATSTVAENAAQGTTIFTASATDPDSIKSIVYSISGGAHADLVQIDGETGAVTVIDSPNIDSNPLYEFVVTASDSDDSNLSSSQSVTVLVTEASALPTSQNKTIGLTENSTKYFAASDFAFFDEDGDTLSKILIQNIHESAAGQLKLNGAVVTKGQEILPSQLSSLSYTPGTNEVGDAYARISYKVHDGTNYSESSNHIFINVEEENLTSSSSKALTASPYSSGMSFRLLSETTGAAEIDNLMSGAGWSQSDGEYG